MFFVRLITVSAAALSGLILFAVAARGFSAIPVHLALGDVRSAVLVGILAVLLFGLSLTFLMPRIGGRVLRNARGGAGPAALRIKALVVLCCFLIIFLVVLKAAQGPILGLLPLSWLPFAILLFVLVFGAAYVLPGLAYRMGEVKGPRLPVMGEGAAAPGRTWPQGRDAMPPLQTAPSINGTWPHLKPGHLLNALIWLTIGLAAASWFARDQLDVIPTAAGLDRVQPVASLAFLAVTVLLSLSVIRSPMSHRGTRAKRVVVKTFAILVLTLMNGLWASDLPQRIIPFVAEEVLGAEEGAQRFTVVSSRVENSGRGICGAAVTVALAGDDGTPFEVCRLPRDVVAQVRPGQEIEFLGRITAYGLIWERVRLP